MGKDYFEIINTIEEKTGLVADFQYLGDFHLKPEARIKPESLSSIKTVRAIIFDSLERQKELPFEVFFDLNRIEIRDLKGKIPAELFDFEEIEHLLFEYVEIDSLDEKLILFKNLKTLTLRECSLNNIPKVIFKIATLEELNLNRNNISSIPKGIVNLKELYILDLEHNNLKELPFQIVLLPELKDLYLGGNPLTIILLTNQWVIYITSFLIRSNKERFH